MATLYDTKETVAIKKVKQDKRYKVSVILTQSLLLRSLSTP